MNDFRPYIYKLTDFGRQSKRIDRDLPNDNFIRVVREDPERQGLLFAGGEVSIYVSFDEGDHWQSLALNLPPVPITDLAIRQGDLVAATQGRAFWVLDDLSALRQVRNEMADKPLHVFTPGTVEKLGVVSHLRPLKAKARTRHAALFSITTFVMNKKSR